ncbi:hypothetical protein FRB94_007965 [Tulasnella sp. JGI-2019a]|nr:hypothetical protein FRB94_007965 [Tulasnella sp. JGI-2019a]
MKDAMEETLIMLCACDLVCLQSLTISTGEYSPPSLMDPTPLMNFLRRNVSLKRVILELPVPAGAVMEVLSHISQLQALGVRWWRDSSNTESEAATGTMIVPESLGSLRSLHRIACDKVSTLRHILAYASVCLLTSLQIEVHSSAVAQELFGVIQSCSSLKSLQITPPRGCGRFVWPRFAEMGSPLDAKLSFDSVLACTAMESFRIHAKGILPPNDIDLWSISTAWTNLSTFAWSSWSVYTPRATLTGLSALSTNCRKLQRVGVPIMVNPELPIHTPYQPFCDGIMVDTVEWKVDNAVNVEELIGVLATLAPRQWSRDGTQWLSTRKAKKGLWKVIEDKFGNYQLDGGLDVVVVRFDRDVGA